jgi:hypothetical protein
MSGDSRGWRIALLPDALLNTPRPQHPLDCLDVLAVLDDCGYGVLQLPPEGKHPMLLAVIADQIAEYAHHGYAVVAVGVYGQSGGLHWRRLASLLRHRGVVLPPRHLVRPDGNGPLEKQRLAEFLNGYDLPPEQQRRWRV